MYTLDIKVFYSQLDKEYFRSKALCVGCIEKVSSWQKKSRPTVQSHVCW